MAHTRKLHYKDINAAADSYVGNYGDLWFDPMANVIRVYNGQAGGHEIGSTALPVVAVTAAGGYASDSNTQVPVHISVASTASVTATGVLFVATDGWIPAGTVQAGTASSGTQTIVYDTGNQSGGAHTFTVVAFATNSAGTAYSAPLYGGQVNECFPAGTVITLADGTTKPVEQVTHDDLLLVWDFDKGTYAAAHPLWVRQQAVADQYNLLTFSDGSTLRTVGNHHIFNKQAEAFTHTMTERTPVGTVTVNDKGEEITLVSQEIVRETVDYYNIWTDYHMSCYADHVLTGNRFLNIDPIVGMKFVKNTQVERYTANDFENIDSKWVEGLRLAEQPKTHSLQYIHWYITERLEKTNEHSQVTL